MTLIIGTLAYDEITQTGDPLDGDHVRITNWQTRFGGCGGNIAWNLARLGFPHHLSGYLGADDGQPYLDHLAAAGADISAISLVPSARSARAFIVTGADGRQFTAFQSLDVPIEQFTRELQLTIQRLKPGFGLITPDHPEHMLAAMHQLQGLCPIACYPGQYTSHLDESTAAELFTSSDVVFQNAAEHARFQLPARQMVIVTSGAAPIRILTRGTVIEVPVPHAVSVDPTGCGDAFTAAFLAAWRSGSQPTDAARSAIRWAQRCLSVHGSQCH